MKVLVTVYLCTLLEHIHSDLPNIMIDGTEEERQGGGQTETERGLTIVQWLEVLSKHTHTHC